MPAKKIVGIGRISIRCEPWFADLVAEAAKKTGRSLSSYVRIALQERMHRDGLTTDMQVPRKDPAKRRGRPRNAKK
jgi:hypothetical protein